MSLIINPTAAAPQRVVSDGQDRVGLSVVAYQGAAAQVSDVRELDLPRGEVVIEARGFALGIDPESVVLVDAERLQMHAQRYRYDLLNRQSLLRRFIGQKIKYSRHIQRDGLQEKVLREGTLLAVAPEIVRFGDEIEIEPEGTISLPYVPDSLRTTPTLEWSVDNRRAGRQKLTTRYLAAGLDWRADYVIELDGSAEIMDLTAGVTLTNGIGMRLEGARMTVIAGDVARVQPVRSPVAVRAFAMREDGASARTAQSLSEYYRYSFDSPVDLANDEIVQLPLLKRERLRYERVLVANRVVGVQQVTRAVSERPEIEIRFRNEKRNQLGVPLPSGVVRVYQPGNDGEVIFLGASRLENLRENDEAVIRIGRAYDVVIERVQKRFRRQGTRQVELTWEIAISNRKDERQAVILRDVFPQGFRMLETSAEGEAIDSQTYEWQVVVPANDTFRLSYVAGISW